MPAGNSVRALVRPGSDAHRLEAGATIALGDVMDPASLDRAMEGVDGVVTSTPGYTRHRKGDTAATDTAGNANLIDAAHRAGVRRFVLTSILPCDRTPDVPHFWHKKLAEDRLERLGVPFVALRPRAFVDMVARFRGRDREDAECRRLGNLALSAARRAPSGEPALRRSNVRMPGRSINDAKGKQS